MTDIEVVIIHSEDATRGAPPPPRDPFSDAHRLWRHHWAPRDPMAPDYDKLAEDAEGEPERLQAEGAAIQ